MWHAKRIGSGQQFHRLPQLTKHVWMFSFGANVAVQFSKAQVFSPALLRCNPAQTLFKVQQSCWRCENVFANVVPAKNSRSGRFSKKRCVHGVIHMIRKVDLENIFDKRERLYVERSPWKHMVAKRSTTSMYYGNNGKDLQKFSAKPIDI